jgi:hypothetical protein
MRLVVDELDSLLGKPFQLTLKIAHLECDVMHARPSAGEKLADRRLLAERREQLDATVANAQRRRFDTLLDNRVAMLNLGAEELPVRVHRIVEILDGDSEMVDPLRAHARGS